MYGQNYNNQPYFDNQQNIQGNTGYPPNYGQNNYQPPGNNNAIVISPDQ